MIVHLVVGHGEVGSAIAKVLRYNTVNDVQVYDPAEAPGRDSILLLPKVDYLHICFPYSDSFIEQVQVYRKRYKFPLTIIHSTVPVGTSRQCDSVHSPVSGRHPNLVDDLNDFAKFFGAAHRLDAEAAAHQFALCGVMVQDVSSPEETEAGKLWATLQYGWLIALQKECKHFCEHYGLDPAIVYDLFNKMYNEGNERAGRAYRLPILTDSPGPIGGHCVIPNAQITDSPLATALLHMNETWAEDVAERVRPSLPEVSS